MRHPAGREIVAEADIHVTPRGALRAKLVVFKTRAALRRFWQSAFHHGLGRGCRGVVNSLRQERRNPRTGDAYREVDPRYFCVIGLCMTDLTMDVICHEANHAGFYYFDRHHQTFWRDQGAHDSFDEEVCYPTGRIAASINRFLHDKGLYE